MWFSTFPAHGQTQNSDGPAWCGTAWACDTMGLTGKPAQGEFAGLALGGAAKVGVATGQASADAAENLALSKCAASNANQACHLSKSTTGCIGLAGPPGGDVTAWDDPEATRVDAWIQALKACGAAGCQVEMTACAGEDDPRTPPLFPLPPNVIGGKVDPAAVGTWEIPMNPGRWVWEIAANGTYEFHTEAPDGAPSRAGIRRQWRDMDPGVHRGVCRHGWWHLFDAGAEHDSDDGKVGHRQLASDHDRRTGSAHGKIIQAAKSRDGIRVRHRYYIFGCYCPWRLRRPRSSKRFMSEKCPRA